MAQPTTHNGKRALLDLDALQTRAFIRISGKSYEYRNPEEFTVFELRRFERLAGEVRELEALPDIAPEQEADYKRLLAAVVTLILVAPADIITSLQPMHSLAIMLAFSRLLRQRLQPTGATSAEAAPVPPIGASSRRGSRASTVGRRKAG